MLLNAEQLANVVDAIGQQPKSNADVLLNLEALDHKQLQTLAEIVQNSVGTH
jgi:hypothetical protein